MRFAPHKLRQAPRRVIALLAVIGSLGVVAVVVLASNLTRSSGPVLCSGPPPMRQGAGPLIGGRRTTVAGAQSAAGFPVLVPYDPAVSPARDTQTWVSNQAVAFSYARSKINITMTLASYPDPLTWFHTFIAENHVAAAIGQVNSEPALVITPDTDECGGNPAWVEFDHNGVDIDLSSHDYGTTTLLAVADSMRQYIPWRPAHLPVRLRTPDA
jgi:hypothetical protein